MNLIKDVNIFHSPLLVANHILDPLIENGLYPRSLVEEGSGYINFKYQTAGCIGAIVLGLELQERFPRRYTEGLMEWLCEVFDCTENYLEGVEAGFDGGLTPPNHLLNKQYKDGYIFGKAVINMYNNPRQENFQGYTA